MRLFVPLYGPFRDCLKWVVLVPAHGPRPQPKPGSIYRAVPCRVWTVLFFVLRASHAGPNVHYSEEYKTVLDMLVLGPKTLGTIWGSETWLGLGQLSAQITVNPMRTC
jgi:hypothetical protein